MTTIAADLLPSAKQAMEMVAAAEAEKAREDLRLKEQADAKKKALVEELSKPSGISEDEALKRAAAIINQAVKNGLTEVEVLRFPNALCTDRGRAINNGFGPGWENTLTGLPKEMYQFWDRHLRSARIQNPHRLHRLPWRLSGRHRADTKMGRAETLGHVPPSEIFDKQHSGHSCGPLPRQQRRS